MKNSLVISIAQVNPTVGDVDGNLQIVRAARAKAAADHADLVIAGELTIAGYPPEDLVLKRAFQERVENRVRRLAAETADDGPAVLIGAPWGCGGKLHNAALLLDGGSIAAVRLKHELPNYGVFDEKRVFEAGPLPTPVSFRGIRLGVMICEDMWFPTVAKALHAGGAEMLLVLNGSPFEFDKPDARLSIATRRVEETGLPLVYVNIVGGQDELVFDGESFALDSRAHVVAQLPSWKTSVPTTRWKRGGDGVWACEDGPHKTVAEGLESIYLAMLTGLRDYVNKNGFHGVVIGLSGGIDSALTAAVAVDALGPDRVRCVMMPSPYTSAESVEDATAVAKLLRVRLDTVSIEPAMNAFAGMLSDSFAGTRAGVAEENIQARARGMVLMAISNKHKLMVVTTGNKSEMSVGYATLYGDMCGGYSVLKDVYKTTIFALARWRNENLPAHAAGPKGRVMPERVITKAPSAELRPNQTDQDTLPPYEELDAILKCLIEEEMSRADTVARGHDNETVQRVWRMLDRAEYKRRQAPPGVKITRRAFGRDRRYPITNGFTDLA